MSRNFLEHRGPNLGLTSRLMAQMAVLSVVCLVACEPNLAERTQLLTGPDAFVWAEGSYQIKGEPDMGGHVTANSGLLGFYAGGFPPGTKFKVLGASGAAGENGSIQPIKISFASEVGDWPIASLAEKGPSADQFLETTVEVQPVGGRAFAVPLKVKTIFLEVVTNQIDKEPLVFANDEPYSGPARNVLLAYSVYRHLFGKASVNRDLDAIALVRKLKGWSKKCGGYKYQNGKTAPDVTVSIRPTEVTTYARRTGKPLDKKVFDANPICPKTALGRKGTSYFPTKQVNDYLRGWLAAQSESPAKGGAAKSDGG